MNRDGILNIMYYIIIIIITLYVLRLLLFAPCTVNGITYYRGIRGCNSKDVQNY